MLARSASPAAPAQPAPAEPALAPGSLSLLFDVLVACADGLKATVEREVLAPEGLSWTSWQVLAVLSADGDKELRELALEVNVAKTTASYAVQRLVDCRLATRAVHPADRRRVVLSATTAGLTKARRVRENLADASVRAVLGLSPQALAALRAALACRA